MGSIYRQQQCLRSAVCPNEEAVQALAAATAALVTLWLTPTYAHFHNLCILLLLGCYMFRHCHHLEGAYIKISLNPTAINSLQ